MIDLVLALLLGVIIGVKTVDNRLSGVGDRLIGGFLSLNTLLLIGIVGMRAGSILRSGGGSLFVFKASLLFSAASILASFALGLLAARFAGARK